MTRAPLRLPDSTEALIAPQSLAAAGQDVAMVGTYVTAFRRSAVGRSAATIRKSDVMHDSLLGLIRHANGTVTWIPRPFLGRDASYPRVARADGGGWHVLFVERPQPRAGLDNPADSLAIWYGHFDGQRWQRLQRVALVTGAALDPNLSSSLVAHGDTLGFAFALGSSPPPGVVLLQGVAGRWRADTLRTPMPPSYLQLLPNTRRPGGGWQVFYTQSQLLSRDPQADGLFVADATPNFTAPVLLWSSRHYGLMEPTVTATDSGFIVTWWQEGPPRGELGALRTRALLLSPDYTRALALDSLVLGTDRIVTTPWAGGVLLLAKDRQSERRVQVVHLTEGGVERGADLLVQNHYPIPITAIALSATRLLVTAADTGSRDGGGRLVTPPVTYLNDVEITCGAVRAPGVAHNEGRRKQRPVAAIPRRREFRTSRW